jgi:hypothetical protein
MAIQREWSLFRLRLPVFIQRNCWLLDYDCRWPLTGSADYWTATSGGHLAGVLTTRLRLSVVIQRECWLLDCDFRWSFSGSADYWTARFGGHSKGRVDSMWRIMVGFKWNIVHICAKFHEYRWITALKCLRGRAAYVSRQCRLDCTLQHRTAEWQKDELARLWKQAVVTYSKAEFRHLFVETEETNYRKNSNCSEASSRSADQ